METKTPYRNRRDKTGECSEAGSNCEELFRQMAESRGYTVIDATREMQFSHVDFLLEKDGKQWSFECKARKKTSRKDDGFRDDLLWVEWVGVHGKEGWLVSGAEFLALEQENEFLIVKREDLEKLARTLVDFEKMVDKSHKALNCLFRRFRRKDRLSLISMDEVRKLKVWIWEK